MALLQEAEFPAGRLDGFPVSGTVGAGPVHGEFRIAAVEKGGEVFIYGGLAAGEPPVQECSGIRSDTCPRIDNGAFGAAFLYGFLRRKNRFAAVLRQHALPWDSAHDAQGDGIAGPVSQRHPVVEQEVGI